MEFSKKFGCSVTLLSLLALFAFVFNFTLGAVLFLLVLLFANEERLRNNVSVMFVLDLIYTVVANVVGEISVRYINLLFNLKETIVKLFKIEYATKGYTTITNVFEWLQKLNAFKIINGVLGFAMFVIAIIFLVMIIQGKTLKFPGISKLVEKNVKMEKED